jgi:predicted transcriptional regulator
MCGILLSINPEHVENIFAGKKEFEYRKIRCKKKVDKIFIYSTYPVMKVVGEADIVDILEDKPEEIWEKTKYKSGINKQFFENYYESSFVAVAYKLHNIIQYDKPKELNDFGIRNAPQSFVYIRKEMIS